MTNRTFSPISLPWGSIETILLDMDGTLLDLHFDNYFWTEYIQLSYSKKHSIPLSESQRLLRDYSEQVKGTLDWYCLDYWSNKLALDIPALKNEVGHKISFRPNVIRFLNYLCGKNKKIILATNAHPKTLELKLLRANFRSFFCHLSSSHEIGYPKEALQYWEILTKEYQLDPSRCLFIDDSLPILNVAKDFGIGFLLGITQPDSQKDPVDCSPYTGINDFSQLI